jgi:uncharacterized membrane protein YkoI
MIRLWMRATMMLVLSASVCAAAGAQTPKKSKSPASLKKKTTVSPEEARAIALKQLPGEIEEEELEREHGKLVYSYDIRPTGQQGITEVQVSAVDGSIVSVEKEDAASEAREKQQERDKSKP